MGIHSIIGITLAATVGQSDIEPPNDRKSRRAYDGATSVMIWGSQQDHSQD